MVLFGGSLLVTGVVFSFAQGIIHPYYTVALAPAIGAIVGIGCSLLWHRRHERTARYFLALAIAATAVWGFILWTDADLAPPHCAGSCSWPACWSPRRSRSPPGCAAAWPSSSRRRPVGRPRWAGGLRHRHGRDRLQRRHPGRRSDDSRCRSRRRVPRRVHAGGTGGFHPGAGGAFGRGFGRPPGAPSGRQFAGAAPGAAAGAPTPGFAFGGAVGGRRFGTPGHEPPSGFGGGGFLTASSPGVQLTALLRADASHFTWVAATVKLEQRGRVPVGQ